MSVDKVVEMATVRAVKTVAQDIVQVDLYCPKIASLVLPGQFVTIEPGIRGSSCRRPFTVYFREGEVIRLVFQVVGPNTQAYAAWQIGQRVEVLGPIGKPIHIDPGIQCFLLVAGGCGLASMLFPAWEICEQTQARAIVVAGFRNRSQIFGLSDFARMGVTMNYVTQQEDRKTAVDLLGDTLRLGVDLPSPKTMQIITCGPKPMMAQVALLAQQAGISCLAFIEQVMGCGGVGCCKSCAVPMISGAVKYVCKDGPVFTVEEVKWDELR